MPSLVPSCSILFGVAVACLGIVPTVRAQSCEKEVRQISLAQANATVSVSDMRIPRKAWQHFEKARAAGEAGQEEVLEREAAKALLAAPQFTEVYMLRAAAEVQQRHYDAAIATIVAARKIAPQVAWSSVVLASALTGLSRFDEAAAELDRARGAETGSWQWKFERTRAEIGRRDADAALRWSELTLAAAPAGCPSALLLRANAFQIAGRNRDAITQMETYLTLSPQPSRQRLEVERVLDRTRQNLIDTETLLAAK